MNHMLQVVHVLVIGSDVEDGGDRVSELDRKLLDSGTKSYWGVHASSITGVVVPIHLIQADKKSSTVVIHHVHAYVDVSFVAVVHPAHRQVSVKFPRMDIQLEVVIAELQPRQGENHRLHHTISASSDQVMATILLQIQ